MSAGCGCQFDATGQQFVDHCLCDEKLLPRIDVARLAEALAAFVAAVVQAVLQFTAAMRVLADSLTALAAAAAQTDIAEGCL